MATAASPSDPAQYQVSRLYCPCNISRRGGRQTGASEVCVRAGRGALCGKGSRLTQRLFWRTRLLRAGLRIYGPLFFFFLSRATKLRTTPGQGLAIYTTRTSVAGVPGCDRGGATRSRLCLGVSAEGSGPRPRHHQSAVRTSRQNQHSAIARSPWQAGYRRC